MQKTNIILTGFMGTGKTTVGRALAATLGLQFVDTDELIVARDGRSIPDIFQQSGEAAFRRWERHIAQELAEASHLVVATGGRMLLDDENAALLQRNGRVVCLTATPDAILARLAGDNNRPLLAGENPKEKILALLAEREVGYGRFPQLHTTGKEIPAIVTEIIDMLNMTPLQQLPITHPQGHYPVWLGSQLLGNVRQLANISGPYAVITDENVGPLYAAAHFPDAQTVITLPAGEQYKNLESVRQIYDQLFAAGLDRKGTLVALGGGVIGDMTGFVAAIYMRGIDFVQCPTTLLAMVDASVGGKTGVDVPQGKNLIGAFKQPTAVIADITTLQTLPKAEFAAGMAEVIKHGLINAPELFAQLAQGETEWTQALSNARLQALVYRAIQVKRDVVQDDPFEQGKRALLNLGHTFGHAVEQVSQYQIRHGEGVAMGLVCAANLSTRLGLAAADLQGRIESVLLKTGLPVRIPTHFSAEALYKAMGTDKKKAAGKLRFVLIRDVGDCVLVGDVCETAVLQTLVDLGAAP
ncbi:MAG: bifunctional shikimate kinase/3-dehydroquinate synthase [Candidatus Promineifilaceae bacterium]